MRDFLPFAVIAAVLSGAFALGFNIYSEEYIAAPDRNNCQGGYVSLTYDDGPTQYTEPLIEELKEHGLTATFFVNGYRVAGNENLLRRISKDFQLGNHSYYHVDHTEVSRRKVSKGISKSAKAIKSVVGEKPVLFRPPYGATNKVVSRAAKSAGSTEVLWTIDTKDWEGGSVIDSMSEIADGDIVLMHDDSEEDIDAVPGIKSLLDEKLLCTSTISPSEKTTKAWKGGRFNAEVSRPVYETGNKLIAPSIGLKVDIAEGVSLDILDQGYAGHFSNTAELGAVGNYALAGHRVTNGEPFRMVPDLNRGDKIVVRSDSKKYVYKVFKSPYVVNEKDTWVLGNMPKIGERVLTLVTCASLLPTEDRTIVHAALVKVKG